MSSCLNKLNKTFSFYVFGSPRNKNITKIWVQKFNTRMIFRYYVVIE